MGESSTEGMHYGVLPVQLSVLGDAVFLPSGYRLVSAQYDMPHQIINFLVESADLPETPEGADLPRLNILVTAESHPQNYEFRKLTGKVVVS